LKWVYAVFLAPGDNSHGYVDEVSWTPGQRLRSSRPAAAQSQVAGLDTAFNVAAGGTPPFITSGNSRHEHPRGNRSAYTVTNVQSTNLGLYSVVVTNSIGSITSSCAPLVFGQVAAWGVCLWSHRDALEPPMSWPPRQATI